MTPGRRPDTRATAHELRTHLQALAALVERAPRRGTWAGRLRDCTRALLETAEEWLAPPRPADFSPAELARDVVGALAPAAEQKGLGLTCAIARDCPREVRGDRRAFRALVANLAGNAIKFTEAGQVSIRLSGQRVGVIARLRLEVHDTGPGLPPSRGDSLRELGERSRREGGTGLGIARARASAASLGGELRAGRAPGGGARFVADLALPVAARRGARPRKVLRVLVIDDHPLNRDFARRHLGRRGHAVVTAADGREALRAAARRHLDVALVDLRLPGIGGADLADRLLELHPCAAILAWTAETGAAGEAAFTGVLGKPCEGTTLGLAVETAAAAGRPSADQRAARRILLRRGEEECGRIDRAWRTGSAARIGEEAHRARGALALAGLAGLARLAARAEREARGGRAEQAGRTLAKISGGLRRLGARLIS